MAKNNPPIIPKNELTIGVAIKNDRAQSIWNLQQCNAATISIALMHLEMLKEQLIAEYKKFTVQEKNG